MDKTPRRLSDAARDIIHRTYVIGSVAVDPHKALTDVARSVIVFGDLLQDLSDQYTKAKSKVASGIIFAGRIFWGLVELSVPDKVYRYVVRNLLTLIASLSAVIIGIGLLTQNNDMWSIGVALLICVSLVAALCWTLRFIMVTARIPPHFFGWVQGGAVLLLAILFIVLALTRGYVIANWIHEVECFFRWSGRLLPSKASP